MLIRTVRNYIEKQGLLESGTRVITGLSGGADSVVLLSVLHALGYECLAAHCNFHLRDGESFRDEQFAAQLAASLRIPFFKQDFDTRAVAKERGISIEMAARDLRYEWFEELRKNHQAAAIAVAHHRDDSIETLLLNLIRGTGIKGMTGIRAKAGFIIRPLLCVSKAEILQFAEANNWPFITDSSNLHDEFIRNKIRMQVIPLLETINPSVRETLIQTIHNLNEAAKIYDAGIEQACLSVFDKTENRIDIARLKTFPSPEAVLFELLKDYGFGKEVIIDAYRAIDSQPGKEFYAAEYCLLRDRTAFLLSRINKQEEKQEYLIHTGDTILEFPFRMEMLCIETDKGFKIDRRKQVACFDFDRLQFPLILRKWQIGDKFVPFGMHGFQKLSDYFSNNKFSKFEKEKTWVLVSGTDIIWVVNHRMDDRFKTTKSTKKGFILKLL
jgi:tRNA(Ile)-lysidine synthase